MLNIRDATAEDHTDISVLLVSVFDQPEETKLVQELRKDGDVAFELLAEDEEGPTLTAMRSLAREKSVTLICPVFERVDEERCFNTAFVIVEATYGFLSGSMALVTMWPCRLLSVSS